MHFSQSPQKKTQSCRDFSFNSVRLSVGTSQAYQTSEFTNRAIVNPCCFKYIHLQGFVTATTESKNPPSQDAVFFFLIWLCWVLVVAHRLCDLHCRVWGLQLQHVGSSSLNRDRTWAPSIGSKESSPSHWATREVTRWCLYYPGQATPGCDRKWSHNLRGLKE